MATAESAKSSQALQSPSTLRQLLWPMMVMALLVPLGLGTVLWHNRSQGHSSQIKNHVEKLPKNFNLLIDQQRQGLAATLRVMINDPQLQTDLSKGDRLQLLQRWAPVFADLKNQQKITHMYFFDPQRRCLLRVHKPEKFGDLIQRRTALNAEARDGPASGLELGPLGTLTFRVVQAVHRDGVLLGYVELGKEIEDILTILRRETQAKPVVILDKINLQREAWEQGMAMLGRPADWSMLNDQVLAYSAVDPIPASLLRLIEASHSHNIPTTAITLDGDKTETWVSSRPLVDASGHEVGALLTVLDPAQIPKNDRFIFWAFALFTGFFIVPLLTYFFLLLRRTEKHLQSRQLLLQSREEKYQTIADFNFDWEMWTAADGQVLYASPSCQRVSGYGPKDFANNPKLLFQITHPDDQEKIRAHYHASLVTEKDRYHSNVAFRIRTRSGETRLIEHSCQPVYNAQGQFLGARSSNRDVSERRQAELALDREQDLFSHGPVLTIVWSPDENWPVKFVSKNLPEIFGYQCSEWLDPAFHYADLIHPDDLANIGQEVSDNIREHRDFYSQEYRLKKKDGHYLDIYDFTRLERDDQGKLVEIRGYMFDQSARKAIENQLHQLSLAVTQGPATVVITDLAGNIEYANPRFTATTGYTVDEALGQNPRILKSGEMSKENYDKLWRTLLSGETWHGEFHNKRKDGSLYWESAAISAIRDKHGHATHYLAIKEDITARKEMENRLRETNEALTQASARAQELAAQATQSSAAKSDFLANMSHEIRTPMNGVIGMLSLLMDTELDDAQQRFAQTSQASGEALLSLINDILDFSKIEAGKLSLEFIDFNLRAMLDNFADSVALKIQEKGLHFVCLADPEVPSQLVGDPGRLRQILTNLVGNAVKFTQHGEISVRIQLAPGNASQSSSPKNKVTLLFSVRDTGIGIAKDKISSLFEKFTQADSSTTRKYGGTGLGLAISRQLVQLMGGEIGANSQEQQGTEFWFTAQFGVAELHNTVPKTGVLRDHWVLIIDDHASNRRALHKQLDAWDMHVQSAATWAEALVRLERAPRHPQSQGQVQSLVLINTQLLIEISNSKMRQHITARPEFRWVAMAPLGLRGDAKHFQQLGFAAYLAKPIGHQDLFSVLSQTLDAGSTNIPTTLHTRHSAQSHWRQFDHFDGKILLAEDNPTNQLVALGLLKKMGLSAEIAENGQRALEMLQAQAYDLVLMDVQMPELDGHEATRRWRQWEASHSQTQVPIIALTAHAMRGDQQRCEAAGMDDYLSKPIRPQALMAALQRWLPLNPHAKTKKQSANVSPHAQNLAPQNQAAPHAVVLNQASLFDRLLGDSDLVKAVVQTFLQEIPKQLEDLKSSLAVGDAKTSERLAHSIKGACANLSGEAMRDHAKQIEQACQRADLLRGQELFSALQQEFLKLANELENLA